MAGASSNGVRLVSAVILAVALAGCSRGGAEPELLNLRSDGTPDEFSILPTGPLEEPASYAALPEPNPGGRSRLDPTPEADAVAALGGRPGVAASRGGDAALLAATGRFGVTSGIRQQLAAEDLAFRQQNRGRPLERLFNINVYFDAYEPQTLDQYRELQRFRAAGIPTSAPPPDPAR
ncbi:MAG: DUF3035 domain-containing protein [Paracoccaceae bacterium]|nr:DUF3035 domain-containing protein [Paracoccaceae bacterium]